ncbi:hypothetical protein [Nostoc sp.]|uniref:hypothetical protein n=1 Tax=Nostoc sp. TaxID=1180 RepID=UPI002FFB4C05
MRESVHTRFVNYQGVATQLTVKNMPRGWVQKQWVIIRGQARNEKAFMVAATVRR